MHVIHYADGLEAMGTHILQFPCVLASHRRPWRCMLLSACVRLIFAQLQTAILLQFRRRLLFERRTGQGECHDARLGKTLQL